VHFGPKPPAYIVLSNYTLPASTVRICWALAVRCLLIWLTRTWFKQNLNQVSVIQIRVGLIGRLLSSYSQPSKALRLSEKKKSSSEDDRKDLKWKSKSLFIIINYYFTFVWRGFGINEFSAASEAGETIWKLALGFKERTVASSEWWGFVCLFCCCLPAQGFKETNVAS